MRARLTGVATAWRRLIVSWLLVAAPIVQAVEAPRRAVAPNPTIIAIVDVETTGLDPAHHEMVDLGAVYLLHDGRELGRFFVRIHPPHPDRLDPGAAAVNGYSPARWRSLDAVDEAEAVQQWRRFHERMMRAAQAPVVPHDPASPPVTVTFAALNAWFDQSFTDALLRRHGSSWRELFHYQILDLPSMAWAQGARELGGAALAARYGLEPETRDPLRHTGESGVEFNLALYRAMLQAAPSP
jgi:DNA polymerase III epsilon subunit-like protein